MAKYRIALTAVYFGELPFYFDAFLRSCEFNPEIDWFVFTDCDYQDKVPDNVHIINLSINDFCQLASEKLNCEIVLSSNLLYKICDFKPFLGHIFESYFHSFDFWGHCDLDIIWGRIRFFITDEMLSKYDIITSRPNSISGHFCIYRNTSLTQKIIFSIPDVINKLKKSMCHFGIDEQMFTTYLQWLELNSVVCRIKRAFQLVPGTPKIYWKKLLTTNGDMQRKMYEDDSIIMEWRSGKAYYGNKELMYFHFHELKKTILPEKSLLDCNADIIRVNTHNIVGGLYEDFGSYTG